MNLKVRIPLYIIWISAAFWVCDNEEHTIQYVIVSLLMLWEALIPEQRQPY
jgi:hypothetical protein